MRLLRFLILITIFASVHCKQDPRTEMSLIVSPSAEGDSLQNKKVADAALLLTRFKSLDELKAVVNFTYVETTSPPAITIPGNAEVNLSYRCGGIEVSSILKSGVSESDFTGARGGTFWDKVSLLWQSPYAVLKKRDLMTIDHLARCRPWVFGKGDVAFFNLAETMVSHISEEDVFKMTSEDLSEKGYLNTFNHVIAQAFMTSIFSEKLADFVADVHERHRMPELATGVFTEKQLMDLQDGPVDNYIDMLNNEWGQELGKSLQKKYSISRKTYWTPILLADYLNEIQNHHSWAFQIAFKPFRPTDEIVIRFAEKINSVLKELPESKSYY